jgi:uncharacterized protein (DUF2235 family)
VILAKNIVVCCDGTGNQIQRNLSHVLKLFRIAAKNDAQSVYYGAGVGTIGASDEWTRWRQDARAIFELATGRGLDADILGAYDFICRNYEDSDAIFLFGFSRGAYTVRAVAGLIHAVGLLPPDQLNIANFALRSYKLASEGDDLSVAWHFSRISGARPAAIRFVGVWDTVASVIVPRRDRLFPQLLMLPYTRRNPSVQAFRHAMAIDERRRMFRLNRWAEPQEFAGKSFRGSAQPQDIKQVWFAGVHGDIGGGYPESESALAKYPLEWMLNEAASCGLHTNRAVQNHVVLGRPRAGSKNLFVKPDVAADAHHSLTWGWAPLEWLPKRSKWSEWPRSGVAGLYLPRGEPRRIDCDQMRPTLHWSVIERMRKTNYRPVNMPTDYSVEQ